MNDSTTDVSAAAPDEREALYVDIANRAQEITGRGIWPSTVKAVLEVAASVSAAAPDERELAQRYTTVLANLNREQARADAAEAERDAARAEVDALRARIEGLADEYDDAIPGFVRRLRVALAARPAPVVNGETIASAAALDALPPGTIVRDRFGGYLAQGRDAMGVAWFHYPVYDHAGSSALVAGVGPVTVCFTPGLTVADEGRA